MFSRTCRIATTTKNHTTHNVNNSQIERPCSAAILDSLNLYKEKVSCQGWGPCKGHRCNTHSTGDHGGQLTKQNLLEDRLGAHKNGMALGVTTSWVYMASIDYKNLAGLRQNVHHIWDCLCWFSCHSYLIGLIGIELAIQDNFQYPDLNMLFHWLLTLNIAD